MNKHEIVLLSFNTPPWGEQEPDRQMTLSCCPPTSSLWTFFLNLTSLEAGASFHEALVMFIAALHPLQRGTSSLPGRSTGLGGRTPKLPARWLGEASPSARGARTGLGFLLSDSSPTAAAAADLCKDNT